MRLKQQRAHQDAAYIAQGAQRIRTLLYTWFSTTRQHAQQTQHSPPSHIAAFWSTTDEPQLQPLLRQWGTDPDLNVSLPVVSRLDAPLLFRLWHPDQPLRSGHFGLQEPTGAVAPPPDVILVPTLGFTRAGDRVGYGKGYYDRTLAQWRAQGHRYLSIGIAWHCCDLSHTPYTPAPHDVRLDAILTDQGWVTPIP